MRYLAKVIALASLLLLTAPSVIYLAGRMDLDTVKRLMIIATVVWFISAAYWMWPRASDSSKDRQQE